MEGPGPCKQECQICLNEYSQHRRAKRLACRHTCCSACLSRMVTATHAEAKGDQRGAATLTYGLGHAENDPRRHIFQIIRHSESMEEANGNNGAGSRWHDEMTRRNESESGGQQHADGPVRNGSVEVAVNDPGFQNPVSNDQTITDRGGVNLDGTDPTVANQTGERPGWSEIWAPSAPRTQSAWLVIVCPWCRGVTVLSDGPSADRLPDDEDIMGAIPMTTSSLAQLLTPPKFTAVFVRGLVPVTSSSLSVGSNTDEISNSVAIMASFNQRPPGLTRDAATGTTHFHRDRAEGGSAEPGRAVPFLPGGYRWGSLPGEGYHATMWRASGAGRWTEREVGFQRVRLREVEEGWNESAEETKCRKIWTGMCAVITLGLGVFMLIYIVLHSVTCSPQPFTMISCR